MVRTVLLLLLSLYVFPAFSQTKTIDSLTALLHVEKEDTGRVLLLAEIGTGYQFIKPETGLTYVQKGLELSRSIKYKKGEATCLNASGQLNRMIGNYTSGIKYHLQALQISETINDQSDIAASYFGIAGNYEDEGNFKEALQYYFKIKPVVESLNNVEVLGGIESSIGLCFLHLGQLDSALKYEQNAYELQINSRGKAIALARLASIHTVMNNYDVALSFYRMGIPVAIETSDYNALTELYSGIVILFQKQQQYDSSIYYGKKELATAQEFGIPAGIAAACSDLFTTYKKNNNADSALKYLEIAAVIKDTLITQEKIRQQQLLSFQEENRQQEKQAALTLAEEKRNRSIQFAAIAIGLISFIILFFLLSRSIVINANWIRFLGVLALLVTFEFIDLLIQPYLTGYTNDSPVLMLFALVIISSILIPLHHKIEKWAIEKMVEKNNAIRLAAAKKTIEELEKKSGNV